jgi:hypothetical protein
MTAKNYLQTMRDYFKGSGLGLRLWPLYLVMLITIVTADGCKKHSEFDDPVEIAATEEEAYSIMHNAIVSKLGSMGYVEGESFYFDESGSKYVGGRTVKSDVIAALDTDLDGDYDFYILTDYDGPGEEAQFGENGIINTDRVKGKEIRKSTTSPVTTTTAIKTAYEDWLDTIWANE